MIVPTPRSLIDILKNALSNLQEIARSEVRLAKAELREELAQARSAGIFLGAGALAGVLSLIFGLLGVLYVLAQVMPNWAAALVIAVSLAILAGVFVVVGVKRVQRLPALPATINSLKKDAQWAKHPTR